MGFTGPIVAVTGNALSEDQQKFRHAGATAVVTKPVTLPTLSSLLRQHTSGSPAATTPLHARVG